MKKVKRLLISLFVLFTLLSSLAYGEELVATLGNLRGEISVIKAGTTEAVKANDGMSIQVGDIVKTSEDSYVDVVFMPKTYIELAGASELKIARNEIDDETSRLNTQVELLSGHLSKAIMNNLPPDANFHIVLNEFLPATAEGYHLPGDVDMMGSAGGAAACNMTEAGVANLTAILTNINGIVEIIRVGEVQAIQAGNNMLLNVGDVLKTGKDSYAILTFCSAPNTFLEVSGNSEAKIIRYGLDKDSSNLDVRVDVLSGNIGAAIVRNLPPGSNFEIVLVDYIPLQAEPFTEPEILNQNSVESIPEPPSQS